MPNTNDTNAASTTRTISPQSKPEAMIARPVALPPIQLPPPRVVHFYIAPLLMSPPYSQASSSNKPDVKENSRKLSHSAVEKRRREKMNDKIERLRTLIPSCKAQFPTSMQQPIHKLSVLQAAINYIKELHDQLESNLPQDDPILKDLSVVNMKKKE